MIEINVSNINQTLRNRKQDFAPNRPTISELKKLISSLQEDKLVYKNAFTSATVRYFIFLGETKLPEDEADF